MGHEKKNIFLPKYIYDNVEFLPNKHSFKIKSKCLKRDEVKKLMKNDSYMTSYVKIVTFNEKENFFKKIFRVMLNKFYHDITSLQNQVKVQKKIKSRNS